VYICSVALCSCIVASDYVKYFPTPWPPANCYVRYVINHSCKHNYSLWRLCNSLSFLCLNINDTKLVFCTASGMSA
jgi:hypothetical protein